MFDCDITLDTKPKNEYARIVFEQDSGHKNDTPALSCRSLLACF